MFSFGFADFDTIEQAAECQKEFNGQMLDGRQVNIDFAQPRGEGGRNSVGGGRGRGNFGGGRGRGSFGGGRSSLGGNDAPSMKLMVRGLSYSTTEENLGGVFDSADRVHIATDRDTGDSRGYVFSIGNFTIELRTKYFAWQ